MADANITKRALAASLKGLMDEKPFQKITVSDICERCGMNRKSFYYHFMDKYDLINWIYDTEFISIASQKEYSSAWEFILELCRYLETERSFYSYALEISGQNSFSEHFVEMLQPLMKESLHRVFGENSTEFHITFFSDAFVMAIKRWIVELNTVNADEFVNMLRGMVIQTAESVCSEMNDF